MYNVRFYNQVIHPDHFKGRLGWCIRVLNAVRWWLETCVQRLVLSYTSREGALPKEKVFELRKVFDLDVAAEKLERLQTSPKIAQVEQPTVVRSLRYAEGRQSSAVDVAVAEAQDMPIRPKRINDMIATYGAPGREKQYGRGRQFAVVEDSFEPLEDSSNG